MSYMVIIVKVLIIHDSKYGNGKEIAKAIAKGLKQEGLEVDIIRAREVSTINPSDYDAFVLGSPTHVGGPTFKSGRATKYIGKSGGSGKPYTTFTTWLNIKQKTLLKIENTASKAGLEKLMDGKAYKCGNLKGPLDEGSVEDAEAFGKEIAKRLM